MLFVEFFCLLNCLQGAGALSGNSCALPGSARTACNVPAARQDPGPVVRWKCSAWGFLIVAYVPMTCGSGPPKASVGECEFQNLLLLTALCPFQATAEWGWVLPASYIFLILSAHGSSWTDFLYICVTVAFVRTLNICLKISLSIVNMLTDKKFELFWKCKLEYWIVPGVVVYAFNPSIREVEAGESLI